MQKLNLEVDDLQNALLIAWELLDEKGKQALIERYWDDVSKDHESNRVPCLSAQAAFRPIGGRVGERVATNDDKSSDGGV